MTVQEIDPALALLKEFSGVTGGIPDLVGMCRRDVGAQSLPRFQEQRLSCRSGRPCMLPLKPRARLTSAFAGSGATTALLAKLACPVCYPAVAGLLSSVGLGAVAVQAYLDLAAAVFVPLTLLALGYRARSRRGFGPLAFGTAAVLIGLSGRILGYDLLFFVGVAGLIGAAVWNLVPTRSCAVGAASQGRFKQ